MEPINTPITHTATTRTTIIAGKALTVKYTDTWASVYTQPINAKTGKPWHARKWIAQFSGTNAKAQGLRTWLYASVKLRKSQ